MCIRDRNNYGADGEAGWIEEEKNLEEDENMGSEFIVNISGEDIPSFVFEYNSTDSRTPKR